MVIELIEAEYGFVTIFGIVCFLIGLAAGLSKKHGVKVKGIRVGDLLLFLFGLVIGYFLSPYASSTASAIDEFVRDVQSIPSIIIAFALIVILLINLGIYAKVSRIIK
ncbi:hypothetical protein J4526_08065 [Desulfurococcaceae archaeon MEX13E-LK6-19]|nr:hypothetical protein J4526_08065 [Desulfurococcaceae archaeon MEX13E-LK6-19]